MNKNVLITGASSGIGYELARIFAKNNYNLILIARRVEKMEGIKSEFPNINTKIIQKDLTIPTSCLEIYEELKDGNVDIIVNNAGFGDTGEFQDLNLEKQKNMIDLNIKALTELTHLFGSKMVLNKSGKILNLASIASFMPGPRMATYFATKAYVLSFSQALSQEWKRYNVQVMALCPGYTESEFQDVSNQNELKVIKNTKMPSSKEVAEFGYFELMKGKTLSIHGFTNNVFAFALRFLSRKSILPRVENILKQRG
jgi:uncharacterized protein